MRDKSTLSRFNFLLYSFPAGCIALYLYAHYLVRPL